MKAGWFAEAVLECWDFVEARLVSIIYLKKQLQVTRKAVGTLGVFLFTFRVCFLKVSSHKPQEYPRAGSVQTHSRRKDPCVCAQVLWQIYTVLAECAEWPLQPQPAPLHGVFTLFLHFRRGSNQPRQTDVCPDLEEFSQLERALAFVCLSFFFLYKSLPQFVMHPPLASWAPLTRLTATKATGSPSALSALHLALGGRSEQVSDTWLLCFLSFSIL